MTIHSTYSGAVLIVEAKREGVSFELPAGDPKRVVNIDYFRSTAPDVFGAIQQAMGYCALRGVQYGAVSNGHQLIAFLASRTDGVPPLEGRALVFESLAEMAAEFHTLWQSMSPSGVREKRLYSTLKAATFTPPPPKLSSRLPDYPGYQNRNNLQTDLQILSDLLIQDIGKLPVNEKDFLRQCYADNGALSQFALASKAIMESRYAALSQGQIPAPTMLSATTKEGIRPELLESGMTARPILLVGDVGVGKTTFIRNLINVAAEDLLGKGKALALYVDMGVKPTLGDDLDNFLIEEVTRQLRQDHGIDIEDRNFLYGVYNLDLQQFEKGLYGGLKESDAQEFAKQRVLFLERKVNDVHEHLRRCLDHIVKAHKKQMVIFFDNVDQRVHEFQQRIFLLGQSVAELWPALVFITLRPETYHSSRSSGTLSAYHPRAFTIGPPRIDRVVEKRLQYAIQLLNDGQLGAQLGIHVQAESLKEYLTILATSFKENRQLVEFIDNMCGGNVRLALDFVRVFIGSGHVDTEKILAKYDGGSGSYTVAMHEFFRAVIFGDHHFYDPAASEIRNLFDMTDNDGQEHFVALELLAYIERMGQSASSAEGFVTGQDVYQYVQGLGFRPDAIAHALVQLTNWGLLESANELQTIDPDASTFRITTIGAYYHQRLVHIFVYVDAVTVDTPIVEATVRATLNNAEVISDRLDRTERFANYLDSQWDSLADKGLIFDWKAASTALRQEMDLIRRLQARDRLQPRLRAKGR